MIVLEALAGLLHAGLRRGLHLVFVCGLAGLFALYALKRAGGLSSTAIFVVAAVLAALGAIAYWRFAVLRAFLTVLAPAPLIFLLLFLFHSPVSKLTLASEAEARVAQVSARAPVVVVVFDEFPTSSLMGPGRQLDTTRYPHFAALARDATWFRNANAVSDYSEYATAAVLTGRYARRDQLPTFADHPQSIFTLLGGSYRMSVFEGLTSICPRNLCKRHDTQQSFRGRMSSLVSDLSVVYLHVALPASMEERLPSIATSWMNFRGGDVQQQRRPGRKRKGPLWEVERERHFDMFVGAITPGGRPALNLIHTELPHSRWEYLPSGKYYGWTAHTIAGRREWRRDPHPVNDAFQRHVLQVGFVDRLLGRLLRRLRRTGLYDRSLILLTADHGVSFIPGNRRRTLTPQNFPDIAFVPLFVKLPQQREGRIDDRRVSTIDIVPTIADALDVELPWQVDGRSALDPERDRGPVVFRARDSTLTSDVEALARKRDQTVQKQIRLFGWDHKPPGFYRIGPRPDLLGKQVSELQTRQALGRVRVYGAANYRAVRKRSKFIPTSISGKLLGPGQRRDVAVAVNGRIRAVGRSFYLGGRIWFSTLVPEWSLREGANEIRVYLVSGTGGGTVLERLASGVE
jgi:hypothetical protein